MNSTHNDSLEAILDQLLDATEDEDQASVDDLVGAFGPRSYGPLLVVPAVLMISPIGAIPLAPAVFSTFVIAICLQHIAGMSGPWLPKRLRRRSVERDKLASAIERIRPWARRIDSLLRPRLGFLTRPPADRLLAGVALLLAASVFALGIVPFAMAVPSVGIALLGLALATRDGLVAIAALASVGGTIWLGVSLIG